MKSLTKKAIVLASAIAVAGAFAVCAAEYTSLTASDATTDNRSVTVTFANTVAASDQITILAYNTDIGTGPDATNIVYIDQIAKNEATVVDEGAGTYSITFSLRADDPTGGYKVLMGGSGVSQAGEDTFDLSQVSTGSKITGTVTPVAYFGDDPDLADYNALWKTSIVLMDADYNPINTFDVNSGGSTPGYFEISELPDATYILGISRVNMCTKYVRAEVLGGDKGLGSIKLLGSDANENEQIDPLDISGQLNAYLAYEGDGTYYEKNDTDVNEIITPLDITSTLNAYLEYWEKGYQEYPEEE